MLIGLAAFAPGQMSALRVSIDPTRSPASALDRADALVRSANGNLGALIATSRSAKVRTGLIGAETPLVFPRTVRLTSGGRDVSTRIATRGVGVPLVLSFDATGPRAFPPDYQAFLQDVFAEAQSTMDLVFGQPSSGGTVKVANFDADIGDRQAVVGGYFVPDNGSGQMEIRFPIYSNPEAAAVNFIHTLLLAYLGPTPYGFDAFQEGLVRAATARIVRTPSALAAGLDPAVAEQVLDATYDVGATYDWLNQRGLGAPRFIAPNLVSPPLPAGGSVGGLYLLRHRMAGSAWLKVLAQYPSFIAELNGRLYAQPSIGADSNALTSAAQSAIDELGGGPSTIENLSFSAWVRRQYVLQTTLSRGDSLVLEPTPITSGLAGSDFGVFLLEAHWFRTTGASGNETLLSGTSFPIFWEGQVPMLRFSTSAQEDRVDLAGAYGAIVPNFDNRQSGAPYRVAVDIPVGDQNTRVYLPAGAIATPSSPTPTNFFGTVIGPEGQLKVRAKVGPTTVAEATVSNGAFGALVSNSGFLGNASIVVEVLQGPAGSETILATRRVNKGPGGLALDLRVDGDTTVNAALAKGINALGMAIDPWRVSTPSNLGLPSSQTLVARFNPSKATNELFPELEPFKIGHGYFVRMPAAAARAIEGRSHPGMGVSVALKPGWNFVGSPLNQVVPTSQVRVVRAANFPIDWEQARTNEIGTDFFEFVPGPNDLASGAPETGTFVAATQFQPGKAYYVRALASEGVSLMFDPVALPTSLATRTATVAPAGWAMRLDLSSLGAKARAYLGQSSTATLAFDPGQDSGLPPAWGGLQAAVLAGTSRMYREMRPLGSAETYFVRLEGLTPGQRVMLGFVQDRGTQPWFTFRDRSTGIFRVMHAPNAISFIARSSVHTVEIGVGGEE